MEAEGFGDSGGGQGLVGRGGEEEAAGLGVWASGRGQQSRDGEGRGRSELRGESPAVPGRRYLGAPELRLAVSLRGGIRNGANSGIAA